MTIDPQLFEIFTQETNERLDRIVATLLGAEAGSTNAAAIDQLFRDAHSIKGNAAMLGFPEAGRVAGELEEVLDTARAAGRLDPALVPGLLDATDRVRHAIQLAGAPPAAAPDPAVTAIATQPRSLRVAADKVDRLLDVVGETVLHRRRLDHLLDRAAERDEELREELGRGELLLDDLRASVVRMRTLPLDSIVGPLPRAVRDAAAREGKEVRLELSGTETQLDRVILDGISETVVHLLRNAVVHGIEPPAERERAGKPRQGIVQLRAQTRGGLVALCCADDGRGVTPELLERAARRGSLADVLAEAGMSTAEAVTDLAGRGVGLDAVKRHVEALGGALEVASEPGLGTEITLLLPVTLAVADMLLVERGSHIYALPLASVLEVITVVAPQLARRSLVLRGETLPLADLGAALGADLPPPSEHAHGVVVAGAGRRAALVCDRLVGEEEQVVKPLGAVLDGVAGYLGAAILGDGRIALVLDPAHLVRAAEGGAAPPPAREARRPPAAGPDGDGRRNGAAAAPKLLVVDDQLTVRELERSILEAAGYRVVTAVDGQDALEVLEREGDVDLVVSDVEMPRLDGFGLLHAIRAHPGVGSLPVVIVTSREAVEDRLRGADAGADAWVVKSEFDRRALLATVGRLVGRA